MSDTPTLYRVNVVRRNGAETTVAVIRIGASTMHQFRVVETNSDGTPIKLADGSEVKITCGDLLTPSPGPDLATPGTVLWTARPTPGRPGPSPLAVDVSLATLP